MTGKLEMQGDSRSAADRAGFLVFWYGSAVVLAILSFATFVTVHNGHRLAAFFLVLGGACFLIAHVVRRAARGPG